MCVYSGMRYPLTNTPVKTAFAPGKDIKQHPTQKFTSAALTLSEDILTSGDMDLNRRLITHPAATFFVKVKGLSMQQSGILPNDILIVDRSIKPYNMSIVLAVYNEEFIIKRFTQKEEQIYLYDDKHFDNKLIVSKENQEKFEVWGVVTYIIHQT